MFSDQSLLGEKALREYTSAQKPGDYCEFDGDGFWSPKIIPLNQKLIVALLTKLKLEIEIVDNGQKAVEKLNTEKFDLIFMDIQMPVMKRF